MSRLGYDSGSEHDTWLASLTEDILEPDLPIVDAHHHMWLRDESTYLLPELLDDVYSGHDSDHNSCHDSSHNSCHKVVATVFAECHSMYRARGPEALRPVGETEFVAGVAAMSDSGAFGPTRACRVMFGGVDMTLGSQVEPVLQAHVAARGGRFRGIRMSSGWDPSEKIRNVADRAEMLREPAVREALAVLTRMGLSFDTWLYHPQLDEVAEVADAFPDMPIILNHVGSPILGGPYRDKREQVFTDWRLKIENVAKRENVVMKLGALPIRLPGGDFDRSLPPSSEEVAAVWAPWLHACIEVFGASRCMFESNFPVHRNWCSYHVVWNAFKRIGSGASVDEKADLFAGTACRAYRIPDLELE
ncbi:MAG: amidohydrolase family protein [Gammaproteobacteria bacterium]|nr:amidohydrolase family protein [Gammaproteobacteria bacterium]